MCQNDEITPLYSLIYNYYILFFSYTKKEEKNRQIDIFNVNVLINNKLSCVDLKKNRHSCVENRHNLMSLSKFDLNSTDNFLSSSLLSNIKLLTISTRS